MKDSPEEVDLVSKWVVIMSADVIQFRNNLLETSIRDGHNWDLSDVSVIRMAERTARRALPPTTTKLWVVRVGESGNGQEVVSVGVEGNGRREDVLLAFEREDEAKRFAEYLIADGTAATHTHEPITRLNAVCNEAKILLGLVPAETLITPGQFKRS